MRWIFVTGLLKEKVGSPVVSRLLTNPLYVLLVIGNVFLVWKGVQDGESYTADEASQKCMELGGRLATSTEVEEHSQSEVLKHSTTEFSLFT